MQQYHEVALSIQCLWMRKWRPKRLCHQWVWEQEFRLQPHGTPKEASQHPFSSSRILKVFLFFFNFCCCCCWQITVWIQSYSIILKNFAKLSCSDGSGWIKDGLWNFTFSSPHHRHKGFLNHFGNTGSCTLSGHLFGSLALSLFHSQPVLYWDAQLIFLNFTSNCIAHYSEKASFFLPAWGKISLTGINDPQQANFIMAYTLITPFEELLLHSKHSHVFWLNPFPHDVSPSWNTFLHSPTGTCQTTTYPSKVIYNSP